MLFVVGASILYLLGYRLYSRWLSQRVFQLSAQESTPAHNPELADSTDYVPTSKTVLWGHHYASIAGAAPIIGPAVAIYWGWLPAMLWILFGSTLIGALHDFGALVLSARNRGASMAYLAGDLIHPRVRLLFHCLVYFLLWIVLTVFAFATGVLFDTYPQTVLPVNGQIVVAILMGLLVFRRKLLQLTPATLVALAAFVGLIVAGLYFPLDLGAALGGSQQGLHLPAVTLWAGALIVYAGVASALPVWLLLQPRDYLNAYLLITGLAALVLGLFTSNPTMQAPAIREPNADAPPVFPLLFITIACGAISGFHGLVSSGTTSKQLNAMPDARPIGYGGMLGEGVFALLATLAVGAGLPNWAGHYERWSDSGTRAIANFVEGGGNLVSALPGVNLEVASTLVAILAICFAATSMDTAARVQRYTVSEIGKSLGVSWLQTPWLATLVGLLPSMGLLLAGKAVWGPLWLLFGTTNQLIGGLTLLVLLVYLLKARRPSWPVLLPMVFVLAITTIAMVANLFTWFGQLGVEGAAANGVTIALGLAILGLELWMLGETGVIVWRYLCKGKLPTKAL